MLLLDARSVQMLVFGIVGAVLLGVAAFAVATLQDRFSGEHHQDIAHG
jgi:hypothetical protein